VEQYFAAAQQRIFDVTVFANGLTNKALISFDIYHAAGNVIKLCGPQTSIDWVD